MNKIIIGTLLVLFAIAGCKSPQKVQSVSQSSGGKLSDREKAEVTNLFFNASKEKILGNMQNAANIFSEVIRRDPDNAAAMYELANIYAGQKKYADALYFIKSAYQLDRKNSWYVLAYSDILQKNRKFDDAADVLSKLVQDYPTHEDYYFEWATALIFADKPGDAVKVYDKLEQQNGVSKDVSMQKARLYQRLGKQDKAIEELKKLIEFDPKDPQIYGMLAEVYQDMGEKEKALETYNKILEVDPENPFIHLSLADFYRSNGEKEKSIAELKKAFENKELDIDTKISILSSYYSLITLHPELKEQALEMCKLLIISHPSEPRAHAVYGDFLEQDERFEEALDEYYKAKELEATEFTIYRKVLFLEAQLQRIDSLKKDSEEALDLFPNQPIVYLLNGIANIQKKNYTEAVSVLNTGVKMVVDNKPLEGDFYMYLGDSYNELKQYDKSDQSYELSIAADPKDPNVLNNYAYFLSLRGEKLEKAEQMSRMANELEPQNASFEDTFGWIMYKQNKFKDAKIWIEKSLSNGSNKSGTVLEHYGDILYKLGDLAQALEYWEKAKNAGEGTSDFIDRKIMEKKLFE